VKFKSALFVLFFTIFGWCSQAFAQAQETRVALVIGNSNYKNSPLKNPVNDARDMAAKLRGLGFTVIERNNLVVKQIGSTLREFRSKLTPGSVALVYYAGHGLQIKGDNYFPTVDADITGEEDVPNQSLAMRQIMDVLGDAKTRLNLVFLDACRDNPYSRSFRSASKGLSKENAPSGTLISFATRPGSVAADGVGRNGLYTGALLEAMNNKGQPIEQVLKRVVTSVKAESKNLQEPWMEGSIEGDFCFGNCVNVAQTNVSDDKAFWDSVKDSRNRAELMQYLRKFPNGLFYEEANKRIQSIEQLSQSAASATLNAGLSGVDARKLKHVSGFQFDNGKKIKTEWINVKGEWHEYQNDKLRFIFEEVERDANSVVLIDRTRQTLLKMIISVKDKSVSIFIDSRLVPGATKGWWNLGGEYSIVE
jgi:hypothetical protein